MDDGWIDALMELMDRWMDGCFIDPQGNFSLTSAQIVRYFSIYIDYQHTVIVVSLWSIWTSVTSPCCLVWESVQSTTPLAKIIRDLGIKHVLFSMRRSPERKCLMIPAGRCIYKFTWWYTSCWCWPFTTTCSSARWYVSVTWSRESLRCFLHLDCNSEGRKRLHVPDRDRLITHRLLGCLGCCNPPYKVWPGGPGLLI